MCDCNALKAYREKCAEICAAVAKEPTDLKLVFDLETTGLNPDKDEILEAAIVTTDGEILFESRFKPETVKEWPGAQNVNGISPKDVENAPGLIDKIGEMATLLQNAKTIVAYNGKQFDVPFLAKYGVHLREDAVIDDPMLYGAVVYGELCAVREKTQAINGRSFRYWQNTLDIKMPGGIMPRRIVLPQRMCGINYRSRKW